VAELDSSSPEPQMIETACARKAQRKISVMRLVVEGGELTSGNSRRRGEEGPIFELSGRWDALDTVGAPILGVS
jgi:hypothetical protein